MAQKELVAARAKAEAYKDDFTRTAGLLKERLKPANMASDAWHVVRDKGVEYSGKGIKAATDRPGAVSGAAAAVLLFLLRKPLAHLLTWAFGRDRRVPGTVKADLLDVKHDYDLTAPSVSANKESLK